MYSRFRFRYDSAMPLGAVEVYEQWRFPVSDVLFAEECMPFKIHWVQNGVLWDYDGDVDSSEIVKSNNAVYGDSRFDDLRYEVANFLKVKEVHFSPKDVRVIAALDKAAARSNPEVRVALIADRTDIVELLRVYRASAISSGWSIEIFDGLESASRWLGVSVTALCGEAQG